MVVTSSRVSTRTSSESALSAPAQVHPDTDWREQLPVLRAGAVTLRALRAADAASLCAALTDEHVTRFISPPPPSVQGFERFIAWSLAEQAAGRYVCFGIVPDGLEHPVGIIQVRQLQPGFGVAEWGFALGPEFWGRGLFSTAAAAVIDFAFDALGVHRLEARSAVANARGGAALRKLGATPEALLRRAFLRNGEYMDQTLWSLVASDWKQVRSLPLPRVH